MAKKGTVLAITGVTVLVVGAVVALFVTGLLVWNPGSSKQSASGANIVCGNDIVDTYNAASQIAVREGATTPSVDAEGIEQVKADILSTEGYKDDPTCQAILFWIAVGADDYEAAKSAHEAVKRLHAQNNFANSNIRGDDPIFNYDASIFPLSPEAKEAPSGTQ